MTNDQKRGRLSSPFWVFGALFVAGLIVGAVISTATLRPAPTRSEMRSLSVEPRENIPFPGRWSFGPYACEGECAGHIAGWEWARELSVTNEDECRNSGSTAFYEGCRYYLEVAGRLESSEP